MKLTHPHEFWAGTEDPCQCEDHISVAHTEAEHHLLAGRRIERRCSVCDQIWDDVAISRHEGCALLHSDGSRSYAHPDIYVAGEVVVYD